MEQLTYAPHNCWEVYNTPADARSMDELAQRYVAFLSQCKTERETILYVRERLKKAGFPQKRGARFMASLQDKTLFAARRGKRPLSQGLRLIGAHTDTPRLDLKQRPLQEQAGVGQAKTHYYGGIRKYQWLARPLALHGVIACQDGRVIPVVIGENADDPVFTVSDLLPHLARAQSEQPLEKAFDGERLNLVFGHQPLQREGDKKRAAKARGTSGKDSESGQEPVKARILALLHERYGIVEEDLYSAELQAVPAGPARFVGLDKALIGGYGHDDRICVFSALEAFLGDAANAPEHTQCLIFWDKEEIGSEGSTGAKSRFFEYCLQDLLAAWEPKSRLSTVLLATKAISADVNAAIDPDWQELHEKLNAATIGHGPCFSKFTGCRGKYEANDAHAEYVAWMRNVFNRKNIPWQMAELGKVDSGGGGTVAMYLASYGMNIIDCGPAVLSMHSPFELASKADLYATVKGYGAFLQA